MTAAKNETSAKSKSTASAKTSAARGGAARVRAVKSAAKTSKSGTVVPTLLAEEPETAPELASESVAEPVAVQPETITEPESSDSAQPESATEESPAAVESEDDEEADGTEADEDEEADDKDADEDEEADDEEDEDDDDKEDGEEDEEDEDKEEDDEDEEADDEEADEDSKEAEPESEEAALAASDPREENSRFRIFVIDSGWNHPASKVLNENLDLIHALTHEDPIYILDKDKSISLLRKNKRLIGHDPIIAVHDLAPRVKRGKVKTRGFRLHLGLQDSEEQALGALKMFARFINTHRDAKDLEADVRHKLHKQGLAGAIEIVGEVAQVAAFEG